MDTTEQLKGTYFYKGFHNLSAGELFFWIFLEEAQKQLGVKDIATLALVIIGQPHLITRTKPGGTTDGTSILSRDLRQWLNVRVSRWPTLTNESIKHLRFSYVNNLGAFVGRWVPMLGIAYLMSDVIQISWKATRSYNTIARGDDKLWN